MSLIAGGLTGMEYLLVRSLLLIGGIGSHLHSQWISTDFLSTSRP